MALAWFATKWAMVTATRVRATTAKRAMAMAMATTWAMAMAMRLAGNKDGDGKEDGDGKHDNNYHDDGNNSGIDNDRGSTRENAIFQIASGPILTIPIHSNSSQYDPCKVWLKKNDHFLTY
jgi:hypothetical protein